MTPSAKFQEQIILLAHEGVRTNNFVKLFQYLDAGKDKLRERADREWRDAVKELAEACDGGQDPLTVLSVLLDKMR